MDSGFARSAVGRRPWLRLLLACACAPALLGAAQASAQETPPSGSKSPAVVAGLSATLEECVTAVAQSERAATFSGEMTAIPGTVRMSMRIEVEERIPGDAAFHTVSAPGLGVWRSADAKVKVYKYLKQVTNLSSPASYRGFVLFRWIGSNGRPIRRAERITAKCLQPASPSEAGAGTEGSSATASAGAGGALPTTAG